MSDKIKQIAEQSHVWTHFMREFVDAASKGNCQRCIEQADSMRMVMSAAEALTEVIRHHGLSPAQADHVTTIMGAPEGLGLPAADVRMGASWRLFGEAYTALAISDQPEACDALGAEMIRGAETAAALVQILVTAGMTAPQLDTANAVFHRFGHSSAALALRDRLLGARVLEEENGAPHIGF